MRDILSALLPEMEAGELSDSSYSPLPCETCMHSDKDISEMPCVRCTSFVPGSKPQRDHRPSDKCYWEPGENATQEQIRNYRKIHGVKRIDMYEKYPPVRCINPKCVYDNAKVHERGLCKGCYKWLHYFVKRDEKVARDVVLMFKLARTPEEKAAAIALYSELDTWDSFVDKAYCLPKAEDGQDIPVRSLWVYYDIAQTNNENGDDPTPTKTQLLERITPGRLELLTRWLQVDE